MNYWTSFIYNKGTYFRDDDVLVKSNLTGAMKESLEKDTFYGHFKKTDEMFIKYGEKRILAIVSEGITEYPEWVEYIKEHIDRYIIELHGLTHINYKFINKELGYKMLKEAKEEIEDTFKVKISRWYTPFSLSGFPDWGQEVCDKLEIKYNTYGVPENCIYFHYWYWKDYLKVGNLLKLKYGF